MAPTPLARADGLTVHPATHARFDEVRTMLGPKNPTVDLTMAYVGTRALFEKAGFTLASRTEATLAAFPRVIMRRTREGTSRTPPR